MATSKRSLDAIMTIDSAVGRRTEVQRSSPALVPASTLNSLFGPGPAPAAVPTPTPTSAFNSLFGPTPTTAVPAPAAAPVPVPVPVPVPAPSHVHTFNSLFGPPVAAFVTAPTPTPTPTPAFNSLFGPPAPDCATPSSHVAPSDKSSDTLGVKPPVFKVARKPAMTAAQKREKAARERGEVEKALEVELYNFRDKIDRLIFSDQSGTIKVYIPITLMNQHHMLEGLVDNYREAGYTCSFDDVHCIKVCWRV